MPTTMRDHFFMVKTKTGRYYHPIREEISEGGQIKRLGCMEHPTHVVPVAQPDIDDGTIKPCIACAMWLVYGQEHIARTQGRT